MSHDRGCSRCGVDPPHDHCRYPDCPNRTKPVEPLFDFGFTATGEDELSHKSVDQERIDKIVSMIETLLNNLAANPDKAYIHWPNRQEKIEEFRQKIKAIAEAK